MFLNYFVMLKLKINLKNIYYVDVFQKTKTKNTVRIHPCLPLWRGAIFLFRRRCWSYQSEKSPFLPACLVFECRFSQTKEREPRSLSLGDRSFCLVWCYPLPAPLFWKEGFSLWCWFNGLKVAIPSWWRSPVADCLDPEEVG